MLVCGFDLPTWQTEGDECLPFVFLLWMSISSLKLWEKAVLPEPLLCPGCVTVLAGM